MSRPEPSTAGRGAGEDTRRAAETAASAAKTKVFEDEVSDAVRYERGLALKCLWCILLVIVVLALRVYFFG